VVIELSLRFFKIIYTYQSTVLTNSATATLTCTFHVRYIYCQIPPVANSTSIVLTVKFYYLQIHRPVFLRVFFVCFLYILICVFLGFFTIALVLFSSVSFIPAVMLHYSQ